MSIFKKAIPGLMILGWLIHECGRCNPIDSLLFTSSFEQELFSDILHGSAPEAIDMFMALDYSEECLDIPDRVNSFVSDLQSRTEKMSLNKKLKTIYKSVQNEFLKKYTLETHFNEMFNSGNFNCVTASALYAIILERLSISYNIKETPTHVYLVADPDNTGFLLETTLPADGLVEFDDRFKTSYVEFLLNSKIISEEEFRNESIQELFAKHSVNDNSISLRQLAGIQYYNKGAALYNKSDYAASLVYLEKALFLYDAGIITYLKSNALAGILLEENLTKQYKGTTLAAYINTNASNAMALQYAAEYFEVVSNELIINHPDPIAYDAYFNDFVQLAAIADTTNFFQTYFLNKGFYLYSIYDYYGALQNLNQAYRLNPHNIRTKQMIMEITGKYLIHENNCRQSIDSLEVYFSKFPFLKQERILQRFLIYCYASTAGAYFEYNEPEHGYEYLTRMERFLSENPGFETDDNYITIVYSQAGAFYILNQQYNQAEQILKNGLHLAPDSEGLKSMLRNVIRAKGDSYEYAETLPAGSGTRKFMAAASYAKSHALEINGNVRLYLCGTWKLNEANRPGNKPFAGDDYLFTFSENHNLNIKGKNERMAGSWKYSDVTCTLEIKVEEEIIHVLINEITPDIFKGVMYRSDLLDDAVEVTFQSSNE